MLCLIKIKKKKKKKKIGDIIVVQLVIIVFHGLNHHQGRYDYFAGRLNGEGFSVYLFDNCGHGRSDYVVDDYEKDPYVSEFNNSNIIKSGGGNRPFEAQPPCFGKVLISAAFRLKDKKGGKLIYSSLIGKSFLFLNKLK